jgi:flagellar hook-associated protein 2
VDGYPAADWIENAGNTVTSVIPGVTLNLLATNGGDPVTVNLTRDTDGLKTDLQNLVAVYNGIVDTIAQYAGYDPDTDTAGVLIGDSGLNLLLGQVRSILTTPRAGFDTAQDTYTMAADIGIEIDRDGYLSLDETALDEALAEDYFGVLELIGATDIGGTGSQYLQFNSAASATEAGDYEVHVEFDGSGNVTSASFRGEGETEWREATVDGNVITGASGNPEYGLQVTFVYDVSLTSPFETTVRVQQGFGGALYDELDEILDSVDGALAIKKDRYEAAIDQLDDRIESQEDRLADTEERLRAKYARLEATLAQLDSFRAAFDALFTTLDTMNSKSGSSGGGN